MRKLRYCFWPFITFVIVLASVVAMHWAQVAELCPENTGIFSESFETTTYKDPSTSVDHWGEGYITLNKLGSNFDIANPEYIPVWINTVTTNDFDLDGWPDLIGSSSSYSNVLAFVRNMGVDGQIGTFEITHWIDGSDGAGGWPTLGVQGDAIDGSGHCGLTSGDYDGDGDIDFLFVASPDDGIYSPKRIWLYENELVDTGALSFTQIDKTSAWDSLLSGIAWSSTMMVTLDFEGDGDIDIVMGNRDGEVLLIKNNRKNRALSHNLKFSIELLFDTGWGGRGVSTVSVGDFDMDGDHDIIVGSVTEPDLRYYKNDGSGNFTLYITYQDPAFAGAATVSIAEDFDKDGDIDLVIGTDNWNYKPGAEDIGGQAFYFRNQGGDFISSWHYDNRPEVFDFDLGVHWDYDQDGDADFLIADGNHSEKYYLFINNLADVYNLQGIALSTNITLGLDPQMHAITKVQMTRIDQSVVGGTSEGLSVEIYVSNNDGLNWEFYTVFEGAAIQNESDLHVHTFKHYGCKLRWKAILSASDDAIPDQPNASFETPRIDYLAFEYTYVERREYSRTSVAAIATTESGAQVKLIIGGTFYFPGWQGHLRAYDVSDMAPLNTTYTELRTVTRPDLSDPTGREIVAAGVTIRWDAGELLDARSAASRVIYTALPDIASGGMNRVEFHDSNVAVLGPILADVNSDNAGLINFIRGEGRYWKLGDVNHSNPIVVGPPDGTPSVMGAGYDVFVEDWEDRPKVLYVGANDGMLHCIDLLTGEELWGFVPHNLLPKLKDMWAVDEITGERYFTRRVYVDGSPVVADVQIAGTWRTILICGQGPGKGSTIGGGVTGNHYFALDVTDPNNPQPLWELTHDTMGETWSVPTIGRIDKDGADVWAAFVGSGYDNYADGIIGNRFYAVDIETGSIFWMFNAGEVDTTAGNGWNIQNTIPGSPSKADTDSNAYLDRIFVADLDGRVWKLDTSIPFADIDSWTAEILYEDAHNYPIVTKPEVWLNPNSPTPVSRLYFGTGGDDQAPDDATYSFIALMDNDEADQADRVEWFLGDPVDLGLDPDKQVGVLGFGEKVWSDPKIGDYIVYFNTLTGSIESVDPCVNIEGIGKLYGRFVVSKAGSVVGSSAFRTAGGNVESLNLSIKTRSAVTLGEKSQTDSGTRKRDVYIQEYDSTIQKLEQVTGGLLKVKSWREIYQIIK